MQKLTFLFKSKIYPMKLHVYEEKVKLYDLARKLMNMGYYTGSDFSKFIKKNNLTDL